MNEWQGPMWNDCGACNWMRRAYETRTCCALCAGNSATALACLAGNLAIGAGLCAVWRDTWSNTIRWMRGDEVLRRPGWSLKDEPPRTPEDMSPPVTNPRLGADGGER